MSWFEDPHFANRDSLWVTEQESYADVIDGYERACRHADATIDALPTDAAGHVPWWPQPEVRLFNVMVHVLTETNRHAGHADMDLLHGSVSGGNRSAASGVEPSRLKFDRLGFARSLRPTQT